jgi:hypothetical protein
MKNLKFLPLAIFVFASLVLTSCKKDVADKLPGDAWNGTMTYTVSGSYTYLGQTLPVASESESESVKITFNEDGTGTSVDSEGESDSFTWTSEGEETVTIIDDEMSLKFTVTTNEKDEQVWTLSETVNTSDDGISYSYTTKIDVKLTR